MPATSIVKKILYQLFLGRPEYNIPVRHTAYVNYIRNLKKFGTMRGTTMLALRRFCVCF